MPLARRRFTVGEYHRMGEARVFHQDDRVELLDGEIVEMTPIGARHVTCVIRLSHLLERRAGGAVIVSVQNPLVLKDRSEPQPDTVLLKRREDLSGAWLPQDTDALLVIEVADTSVEYDREKLRLYAQAGIAEAWLANLPANTVEVHRDHHGERYLKVRTAWPGQVAEPLVLPPQRIGPRVSRLGGYLHGSLQLELGLLEGGYPNRRAGGAPRGKLVLTPAQWRIAWSRSRWGS